jgi:hypothetical protein
MKVVINNCYGGFGLSPQAQKMFAKLKGFELFFYHQTKHEYNDGKDEYERIDDVEDSYCIFVLTKDLGSVVNKLDCKHEEWFWDNDIERDDIDLIEVVEKLGKKASNRYSELKIVEIPDGVEWEINEYDGKETIEEKHRSWS